MASREGRREAFTGEATGQVLSCETGLLPRCRSRSAEEKATSAHDVTACMGRTSRSRRPCARGEVLCTEPGKSHPCPDRQAGPVHEGNSRTMNMHADENSDGVIVPEKLPNKEGLPSAEAVEGRTPPKGNGGETAAARTLRRDTASNGLIAVRRAARQSKSVRFTALLHHITIDLLKRSYLSLERDSAPGIDGVTWQSYGENLEEKLKDLHDKVHRGSYRARPARRTYIPKADGSKRPLCILCLEDKIVQQAVVTVLEAIYEEDFLGFSYGFRPGRGQHNALDALHVGILRKQVNWVLDGYPGLFRCHGPRMDHPFPQAPYRGQAHPAPHSKMAQSRHCRRWTQNTWRMWRSSRRGDLTNPGERLPALCVRSMGPSLAPHQGVRRHDHRSLCGRHHRRLSARARG